MDEAEIGGLQHLVAGGDVGVQVGVVEEGLTAPDEIGTDHVGRGAAEDIQLPEQARAADRPAGRHRILRTRCDVQSACHRRMRSAAAHEPLRPCRHSAKVSPLLASGGPGEGGQPRGFGAACKRGRRENGTGSQEPPRNV
jgi:hypothetical protein